MDDGSVWLWRNYLRVRGEYAISSGLVKPLMELPPRARRILSHTRTNQAGGGTTSACAENTFNVFIQLFR